jgi:hypothetical protein
VKHIRRQSRCETVLQYGVIAAKLLRDIGEASNQPYIKAAAGVSQVIMETILVSARDPGCWKLLNAHRL